MPLSLLGDVVGSGRRGFDMIVLVKKKGQCAITYQQRVKPYYFVIMKIALGY